MALRHVDGMDIYSAASDLTEAGYTLNGTPDIETDGGRYGGGTVLCEGVQRFEKAIAGGTNDGNVYVQAAIKHTRLSSAQDEVLLSIYNNSGADLCFSISVLPIGALRLRDSTGAIVATSDPDVIRESIWHYLEVDGEIGASAAVSVLIDGVTVINESAVDTQQTASDVDEVHFESASNSSATGTYWDDILILDYEIDTIVELQGDQRVLTKKPDADTSTEDWSRKSEPSNSYAEVDDPIPGDHDGDGSYIYNDLGTDNETRFTYEDVSTDYAILAVAVVTSWLITEVTAGVDLQMTSYYSASKVTGSGERPGSSYETHRDMMERAAGGGTWTPAIVNASEFGVESVTK